MAKAGVIRFTACLATLRETIGVRANCIGPGLVDTPASRRSRGRMTPDQLAALPAVLSPADIAAAAMRFLTDDTLAGRIMPCRGGEPGRLLPVTDGQAALARRHPAGPLSTSCRRAANASVWPAKPPWSPGKDTGSTPSAAASASAVR